VHAGPALWGAQNLPDAVFKKVFLGKRGPFWNTCTWAHCNLVTPLLSLLSPEYTNMYSNTASTVCIWQDWVHGTIRATGIDAQRKLLLDSTFRRWNRIVVLKLRALVVHSTVKCDETRSTCADCWSAEQSWMSSNTATMECGNISKIQPAGMMMMTIGSSQPCTCCYGRWKSLLITVECKHQNVYWYCFNKKHLKNVGLIRHCEPPHAHSPGVATGTVARRLRIDVHNDNAWVSRDRGDRYGPINGPNK